MPCRGRRSNHHGAHKHHTHCLQADHDGDDQQAGEQHVQPPGGQPLRRCEFGVKTQQLELFPEQAQQYQRRQPQRGHNQHIPLQECGRLPEEEGVQPRLAGLGHALDEGEQHHAEAEEHGEHQAQGGIGLDAGVADHTHHE